MSGFVSTLLDHGMTSQSPGPPAVGEEGGKKIPHPFSYGIGVPLTFKDGIWEMGIAGYKY